MSHRSPSSARRHLTGLLAVTPSRNRLPVAAKAALTGAVPFAVGIAVGQPGLGLLCTLGGFTVIYGPAAAGRLRLRLMGIVGAGFVLAGGIGAVSASSAAASVLAMAGIATVASALCVALKVGPPGAVFFILVAGVAGHAVSAGVAPLTVMGAIAVGSATAIIVGMSDLLLDPHRPEKAATAAAERALAAYELTSEPDQVRAARAAASHALHAAWTALNDGNGGGRLSGRRTRLSQRLVHVHQRYVDLTGAMAAAPRLATPADADPEPWAVEPDDTSDPAVRDPVAPVHVGPYLPDRQEEPRRSASIDAEQLRATSLGRPRAGYLLRSAFTWPSEVLVVTARVGMAALVAGGLAALSGAGHVYWAIAFATLALHQGGTRWAQTYRAIQRLLGTLIGLVLFMGLHALHPSGWWLLLIVAALQFSVELLVTRNYALAVVFITPLALTIGSAQNVGADIGSLAAERAADTAIAVLVAVAVVCLLLRRTPPILLVAHLRRCHTQTDLVLTDLIEGTWDSVGAREHRRHLYYELLEAAHVGQRARADDETAVAPYLPVEQAMIDVGYLTLGACWHPDLRTSRPILIEARATLASTAARSAGNRADGLRLQADHAHLLEVERILASGDYRGSV